MNKINLLILLGVLVSACSSGGSDSPEENKAPSNVETLIYPTNNLLCIDNTIEFEWSSSTDPDGDNVSYTLEIAQNNSFSTLDETFTVTTTTKSVTLEKDIVYYWRVKAIDSKGLSSNYSSTYQFYTEGEGVTNHLPFAPELIAPELGTTVSGSSINLEWDCADVDNDVLTYDVYFGTETSPTTKVGDNQTTKTLSVSVNPLTNYYWKVVAKDGEGGESIGQIWSFNTN